VNPNDQVEIVFSADGGWYACPAVERECGVWLSLAKHELPVTPQWRRPGFGFAAVMRGRDYYRYGQYAALRSGERRLADRSDELVRDWQDACWWTPGLQEAWAEADGLALALDEALKARTNHGEERQRNRR
jgi:hypothetical protein